MNKQPTSSPNENVQSTSWLKRTGSWIAEKARYFFKNPLQIFWNSKEDRVRSLVRIVISFLAFILCVYGIAFLISAIFSSSTTSTSSVSVIPNIQDTVGYVIFYFAPAVAALWIMSKYFDKTSWKEFGFHFTKIWWLDLLAGIILGAILVAGTLAVEKAAGLIQIIRNWTYTEISSNLALYLIANGFALLAGILAQDIIIRGYLIKNIAQGFNWNDKLKKWAPGIGLMIFSIIFCLLRLRGYPFSWVNTINQFLLILLVGLPYIFTGELGISIGLSFAINFQYLLLDFAVSGSYSGVSPFRVFQSGPDFLTGGLKVAEGGIFGFTMFIFGCALIYLWIKVTRARVQAQSSIAEYIPAVKPAVKEPQDQEKNSQKKLPAKNKK